MTTTTMTMRPMFVLTLAPSVGLVLSIGISTCAEGSGPRDDPGTGGPPTGNPPADSHAGRRAG